MLYAILCYDSEDVVGAWTKEEDDAVMAKLGVVQQKLADQGRLGPVARLLPTTAATTIRKGREPLVIDGPFAETKEQLLGFYVVDCATLEEAIETARDLARASSSAGAFEIRPLALFQRRERRRRDRPRLDRCGADLARAPRRSARCCAISATSTSPRRRSRRPACGRCRTWPQNGPPRDPAAWLIFVGRNVAIDQVRRRGKQEALPDRGADLRLSTTPKPTLAERLDGAHYRDDILRLLFICCHPDLPATQQIALALRIVSGLSVKQIARAFLVGETAMEQRITRAKSRIAGGRRAVRDAGRGRARRAARRRRRDDLPHLQRGLFGERRRGRVPRAPLCDEAIRLARLLLRLFPGEPEIMGLTALLLLQHARAPARFDADGTIVLLDDQDRGLWNRKMIAEGLALIDKAMRHRRRGPYQVQAAIAALHARAARPEDTDWAQIDLLYAALETAAAVAGRHAQPRGRGRQGPRSRRRRSP